MEKKHFAFQKINYILMAISVIVVIVGFILMSGGESTTKAFDPTIFDTRRIKVAPVVTFIGFIMMVFAIVYNPKNKKDDPKQ